MQNLTFHSVHHEEFFKQQLNALNIDTHDLERVALIYLLGIHATTRSHFNEIYDTRLGTIRMSCLDEGFQTSSSLSVTALALGVFNNSNPLDYALLDYFASNDRDTVPYLLLGIALRMGLIKF